MSDVAIATLVLACVTMLAVVVPMISDIGKSGGHRLAALRQLYLICCFFQTRTKALATRPHADPQALLLGLDAALSRALSDDVARYVPHDAYNGALLALFEAHDAFAFTASYRSINGAVTGGPARMLITEQCEKALANLLNALDELQVAASKYSVDLSVHTLHAIPDTVANSNDYTRVLD